MYNMYILAKDVYKNLCIDQCTIIKIGNKSKVHVMGTVDKKNHLAETARLVGIGSDCGVYSP